ARAMAEESMALSTRLGELAEIARARSILGLTLGLGMQDYVRATALHAENLDHATNDQWAHGLSLYGVGHVASMQGDQERAAALFTQALDFCTSIGNLWGVGWAQFRLALLAHLSGDERRAVALLTEGIS